MSGASDASQQAADEQRAALAESQRQFAQTQQNLAPFLQAGQQRVGGLGAIADQAQPGFNYQQQPFSFDKFSDPGAQYLMQQATQAINASALAKGGMGGGLAKSIATENGNIANTAYQGAFDRWLKSSAQGYGQAQGQYDRNMSFQQNKFGQNAQIAGMGQNAAAGLGGLGMQQSELGAGLHQGIGGALAAGTMGSTNALTQGLQGAGGALANYLSQGSNSRIPQQNSGSPDWMSAYNNASSNLVD